jgi:predicted amidophosphoribosyltransferase
MDDYENTCQVCGEDRDSPECCGLCVSCQDDTADWDGWFCEPCARDLNHLSDDAAHYSPDDD